MVVGRAADWVSDIFKDSDLFVDHNHLDCDIHEKRRVLLFHIALPMSLKGCELNILKAKFTKKVEQVNVTCNVVVQQSTELNKLLACHKMNLSMVLCFFTDKCAENSTRNVNKVPTGL